MPSLVRSLPKKARLATSFSSLVAENYPSGLVSSVNQWLKYEIEALVRAVEPVLPNSVYQTLARLVAVCKPDNRDNLTWYYHGYGQRLYAGAVNARRSTTYTNLTVLEEMGVLSRRGGQKRENGRFACDKAAVNYRVNIAQLASLAHACQKDQAEIFDLEFKTPIPERHQDKTKLLETLSALVSMAAIKAKQGVKNTVDKLLKGRGKTEEIAVISDRSPISGLKCSAGDLDKGEDQKLNNNKGNYNDFSAFEQLKPEDLSILDRPNWLSRE